MSEWQATGSGLYKKFSFADFAEAFSFMTRVAKVAEAAGHHPDWKNSWNTVEIWLVSHDKGDQITETDHKLAEQIDNVVQ